MDVVVAGGSLAGVEAACAAAEQGASVLLVDSRPYIGYDLCGSQKLWLDKDEVPETALTKALFDNKRVITPMDVKRVLDQALLKHKVQFLTGSFPAELLVGEDETPSGLTIVNRSGRQAIRAKVVIDATANAVLVRQSAAQFAPFKPGTKEFTFTVVGGDLQDVSHGKQVPDVLFESSLWQKRKRPMFGILFMNTRFRWNTGPIPSVSAARCSTGFVPAFTTPRWLITPNSCSTRRTMLFWVEFVRRGSITSTC